MGSNGGDVILVARPRVQVGRVSGSSSGYFGTLHTPCELQLMITDSRRLVFPEPTYIVSRTSSLGGQVILVRIFILSYALVEC